jgi:hypothetical protein
MDFFLHGFLFSFWAQVRANSAWRLESGRACAWRPATLKAGSSRRTMAADAAMMATRMPAVMIVQDGCV